jgi:hypothetical protein
MFDFNDHCAQSSFPAISNRAQENNGLASQTQSARAKAFRAVLILQ